MDFRIIIMFFLSSLFFLSCKGPSADKTGGGADGTTLKSEVVDIDRFRQLMEEGNRVMIDVRTPEEIALGSIPGSIAIDYQGDGFEEKIKALDRDKEYLVYCRSGGRSGKTAKLMTVLGFKKVYDLEGGYKSVK